MKYLLFVFYITSTLFVNTIFIDAKPLNQKSLNNQFIPPNNMVISQAFYPKKDGSVCSIDTRNKSQYTPSFGRPAYSGAKMVDSGVPSCGEEDKKAFQKKVKNMELKNGKQAKKTSLSAVLGAFGVGCVFGSTIELTTRWIDSKAGKSLAGKIQTLTASKTEATATPFCDYCDKKQISDILGSALGGVGGGLVAIQKPLDVKMDINGDLQKAYIDEATKKIDPKLYQKHYVKEYQKVFDRELLKQGIKPDKAKLSQVIKELLKSNQLLLSSKKFLREQKNLLNNNSQFMKDLNAKVGRQKLLMQENRDVAKRNLKHQATLKLLETEKKYQQSINNAKNTAKQITLDINRTSSQVDTIKNQISSLKSQSIKNYNKKQQIRKLEANLSQAKSILNKTLTRQTYINQLIDKRSAILKNYKQNIGAQQKAINQSINRQIERRKIQDQKKIQNMVSQARKRVMVRIKDTKSRIIRIQNHIGIWKFNANATIRDSAIIQSNPKLFGEKISPADAQKIREQAHKVAKIKGTEKALDEIRHGFRTTKAYDKLLGVRKTTRQYIKALPPEVTAEVLKPYHGGLSALFKRSVVASTVAGMGSAMAGAILCDNGVTYAFEHNKNPKTDL